MPHLWKRFLLLILLNAWLLLSHPAACLAQLRPNAEPEDSQKHGLREVLSQQLIRDRELESLLRSAESTRDRPDAELQRETLLRIFSFPYDVFELETDSATAISLRNHALSILRKSPPDAQRLWVQANQVIAEQELQAALRNGGRLATARVARHFPLTEPGIQAQVLDMSCELLKGDVRNVIREIHGLEEFYAGTVLSSELQRHLRPLHRMLADLQTQRQQHPTAFVVNSDTQLSFPATAFTGTVSPPWPKPLWTWRESIWSFPGVPQPETGYLMMMFDPESANHFGEFNNWCPVFWGESIVFRSPFRLIALNRASGQEQWSVQTDTFQRQSDTIDDELDAANRRASSESQSWAEQAAAIYGMAEFGLVSNDHEFLFFVDRFSFFSARDTFTENNLGRVIRQRNGFPVIEEDSELQPKPVGTRLVALRRSAHSSLPIVAWQIGDRAGFEYHPVAQGLAIDAESLTSNSTGRNSSPDSGDDFVDDEAAAKDPWSGHRFLAPPTGQGTRLFVLTMKAAQVFLNCLQRNTGDLLWRQPLIYTDESPLTIIDKSIFSKRANTCVISGDKVVCSLSDGVIIGVGATDGTLLWATVIRENLVTIPQFRFGMTHRAEEDPIASPAVLVPCISDGIVVCCTHDSALLYGLSLETGEILWKSSRRAFGAGEVGGSPDYCIAGISGDQVILVGDRHCRSVNLRNGIQNWVVQIQGISGRAECRGDRCLIPMLSGQAVTVDLTSGVLISESPVATPAGSMDQYGAVASDDDLICVGIDHQVRIVRHHDHLAVRLSFNEQPYQLFENGFGIEILLRLIDDQRPTVTIVERQVEQQEDNTAGAR